MASDSLFKTRKKELQKELKKNQLIEAIRERTNPKETRSKKVKFTWEGARDFLTTLVGPTKMKLDRVQALQQKNVKANEKDYIDFFEDLEKSLYSAADKLSYAVGDVITTGIDLGPGRLIDTNLTEKLTELYEENEMAEPETLLGKTNSLLIQYGVPGSAVFKILGRLKKVHSLRRPKAILRKTTGAKFSRNALRAGNMATAFAVTDYLATDPGFDQPFVTEEKTKGLTGRELAAARFRNRLRFAQSGAMIGGGFSLAGKPAALGFKYLLFKPTMKLGGFGLKAANKLVIQPASWLASKDPIVLPTVSKAMRGASGYTLEQIISPVLSLQPQRMGKLPPFKEWRLFNVTDANPMKRKLKRFDNILSYFRSIGKHTGNQYFLSSRARKEIKAQSRGIEKWIESLEHNAYVLAKKFKGLKDTNKSSPGDMDYWLNQSLAYLKKEIQIEGVHPLLREATKGLDKKLMTIRSRFANMLPEGDMKQFILDNVKSYMRKSFAVFTNPNFRPPKNVFDDAVEYMSGLVSKNDSMRIAAINAFKRMTPEEAIKNYSTNLVNKFLRIGKQDDKDPLTILQYLQKQYFPGDKLLKTGEELPDAIKRLLGEENNLKSAVLQTSNHAIVQTVNKRLADRLAALGVQEGWLWKSQAAADAVIGNAQKITQLPGLGILESRLNKMYAAAEVAQAFRGQKGLLDAAIQNAAYRSLLQFKVATQFGKTVLSPATQVRNVTSASLFPLASGHIGGNVSVPNAFKMILDDIFGAGKVINEEAFIKNIENKIRLGVIDENIVASELKAVLQDIKKGDVNSLDGLFDKLAHGKFMREATRVYAGGDNVWKWYGHEYVKAQLKPLFRNLDDVAKWTREISGRTYIKRDLITNKIKTLDEAIDESAAWYIRNTYPTYSKVPEVIKAIRRLPFGNFVSFPAEMTRTSFNLIDIAAKEIASSNPILRQMGYRRMIGTYTVLGGAGSAALNLASFLTGITEKDLDAYKRSFAAPWNRRSIMLPLNKWDKGIGKAINFSYFSPYDVVQQPIEAYFKGLEENKMRGGDMSDYFLNEFWKLDGPMMTYFQPFISESIAQEKVMDIIPAGYGGRGGETKTGSLVYSETDSPGDRMLKSFAHVLTGVAPGAWTTGSKIAGALQEEVSPSGKPLSLRDELLALFSGIRIVDVDVPKSMQYKITTYQVRKRSVTKAEPFYTIENVATRGGQNLADEFEQIQEEAFRVQQDMYRIIQDAKEIGLSNFQIKKILRKRKIPSREIRKLMKGEFIPFRYQKDRMKDRVKEAKKVYGKDVDKGWVYPKFLMNGIIRKWKNRSLGEPEEEKTELQKIEELMGEGGEDQTSSLDMNLSMPATRTAEVQTPPLPQTPQPKTRNVGIMASLQKNPMTGLTRTESALLSPSEQVIARRT